MKDLLKKRKALKQAKEIIRHAQHLRNMRGDLLKDSEVEKLLTSQSELREAINSRDVSRIESAGEGLYSLVSRMTPKHSSPGLRENIEIVVVAIAVAMAVRTYFLQPFKIPTGSMQPTLWGITSVYQENPGLMDRLPLKLVKWFGTGEWYRTVRVSQAGTLDRVDTSPSFDPSNYHYYIAGKRYKVPRDAHHPLRQDYPGLKEGQFIAAGQIIWSGIVMAGDHVFVDKLRWSIMEPKRDQIMVFSTDGIKMSHAVPPGTHYIKRLTGLPGDRISISPPKLMIDGKPVTDCRGIAAVEENVGYRTIRGSSSTTSRSPLFTPYDSITLKENEYFALGDNQLSSTDGRYWGTVPGDNLVGPACLVYWPFVRLDTATGKRKLHFGLPR